jgi:hypothetical protein
LLTVGLHIKLIVDNLLSCSGRSIFDLQARSKETGVTTMTNVVDPQLLFLFLCVAFSNSGCIDVSFLAILASTS